MKYEVTVNETCTRIYRGVEAESREAAEEEIRDSIVVDNEAEHVHCQIEVDAVEDTRPEAEPTEFECAGCDEVSTTRPTACPKCGDQNAVWVYPVENQQ